MSNARKFFRSDFGQLMLAFSSIIIAAFLGTLLAGAFLLALVR